MGISINRSISVRLSANQRALYGYVNDVFNEHKHKHKEKAYAYAYVAAVLTSANKLLMLMFMVMLGSQVRAGL